MALLFRNETRQGTMETILKDETIDNILNKRYQKEDRTFGLEILKELKELKDTYTEQEIGIQIQEELAVTLDKYLEYTDLSQIVGNDINTIDLSVVDTIHLLDTKEGYKTITAVEIEQDIDLSM